MAVTLHSSSATLTSAAVCDRDAMLLAPGRAVESSWSATPCSTICTKLAAPRIGMALARIYGKRSNGAIHSIGMGYRLEVTTILRYKRRWIDHPTTIILVIFLLLIMNPNGFYSTDAFKYSFSSGNNSSSSFST